MITSFFMTSVVSAQKVDRNPGYKDSLLQVLTLANQDQKIKIYHELIKTEYDRSEDLQKFATEAIQLARKSHNKELEAFACLRSSIMLIVDGNFEAATERLQIAHDYYQVQSDKKPFVTTLVLQGFNQKRQLFTTQALQYYLKALLIAKEINDLQRINNLYNRISNIYIERKDFEKALYYARLIVENCTGIENCPFYRRILLQLSDIHLHYGNLDSANHYALLDYKSMDIHLDSHHPYDVYSQLSKVKKAENKLADAISYADTALVLATKMKRTKATALIHENLADLYGRQGNLNKQIYYLEQQESLSERNGFLFLSKKSLENLWTIYREKGDYKKATDYGLKWRIVSDSISEVERINLLKRNDELIAQQKQQEKLQQLEKDAIKKDSNSKLWGFLTFFLLTILGLTLYFLRLRYKLNNSLKEKNNLLNRTVEERNILLKEIHHRVKNNLQIISSLLNIQLRHVQNKEARNALSEGRNRVRSIALIHQNLYQGKNFKEINVKEYVESLLSNIQNTFHHQEVTINSDVDDVLLEEEIMTKVGLIINEAVTNVYKHAFITLQKGTIIVRVNKQNGNLLIQIQDDGIGLPSEVDITKIDSLGLQLIRDFATRLKAEFSITSAHPGTLVQLKIPLLLEEN